MELNFKSFGQGEPIIILHGLLGSLDNWQTIAKQLSQEYNVYTLDARNHGKSPHDPTFDIKSMVEDLYDFMDQQGIYRSHLIGHSMGGKTVMAFALQYPHLVSRLIVADIAPTTYAGGHENVFEALLSVDFGKINSREEVDQQLAKYLDEPGVRQFLMKGLYRNQENSYEWKFNLKDIWANYAEVLGFPEFPDSFEGQTLFLTGGRSNYVTEKHHSEILRLFPYSQFQQIDGAGHWLHAEKPQEFLQRVEDFLM